MVVEVTESGEVRLYRRHVGEEPYEPSTRTTWERMTAQTYTNDAMCPLCATQRGTGTLIKDATYVFQADVARNLTGSQIYCARCPTQIIRFWYRNKNHYFTRQVPA